jgi:uncharacterized protein (DUF1501 family)
MERRTLLRLIASAGALASLPTFIGTGRADGQTYGGPYWVFVTALGAWDPRFHFDPTLNIAQNRRYTALGKVGNIPFAPIAVDQEALGLGTDTDFTPYLTSNEQFLTRFGARLTVINGIDTGTNNHETGQRSALSGYNPEGYPAIGALVAATYGAAQPIAFMSSGGYDNTQGLVPLARITDVDALRNLAAPNMVDPKNAMSETYHSADTFARIRAASRARLGVDRADQRLPRFARSLERLDTARANDGLLAALKLPDKLPEIPSYQLDDLERFQRQVELALSGFGAGLVVSANLQIGGFDTHANHDRDQVRQLVKLWGGLGYLFDRLDAVGLGQNTYVVVASDFARGPRYNGDSANAGKDHWPITSMLLAGPRIPGNRVIGSTTDDQLAGLVDRASLAASSTGVKITPSAIHRGLRRLAGISPELEQRYPLLGDDLPLFEG